MIRRGKQTPTHSRANQHNESPSSLPADNWARFKLLLATPVSGTSLAAFRIALGLVMALEAYSLCQPNRAAITLGASPLETYYTGSDIKFHFPYAAFEWLPLLPAQWIHAIVALQALAGVTMALGFCHRASAAAVFLTWAYLFVVESTRTYWQSHYYLETLLTFLMIWMPAARRFSIDAWRTRGRERPQTIPFWAVLLLRGQLLIAYFYAGVAKLNADWLLDAVPVRWFLANPAVTAPYEPYLSSPQLDLINGILHSAAFAYFISYAGLAFDLSIGFLLLIRRTRIFAIILMVLFHAINHFVIFDDIGWFPVVGVTTALVFLHPDWPERWWNWLRSPRLAKPDWNWFFGGAVLFPLVGAALGWKTRARILPTPAGQSCPLKPGTVRFVMVWLVWQTLMPIRHYFILGDGRFTYEGQSFSWRLKTDLRHAFAAQMLVNDTTIISHDEAAHAQINWSEWHGEKVIYRTVTPGRINWRLLPEVVVLLEPVIGERVVYNPYAGTNTMRSELESRQRVGRIWQELYGRQPQIVRRTGPLSLVLDSLSAGLKAGGHGLEASKLAGLVPQTKQLENNEREQEEARKTRGEVLSILTRLHSRDEGGRMTPLLRVIDPFVLEGEQSRRVPFLLIEDSQLLNQAKTRLDRNAWKHGSCTRDQRRSLNGSPGGEPLLIYTGNIGVEARDALPQACIFDIEDHPERPPYIWWNSLKDLTFSKFLHASNQAFYLRRYARRVAGLWEAEYARRPAVHAITKMSLNGRPHQELVDPDVDLASVSVTWFGHNPWIRDLETPRIPREILVRRPAY